MYTAAVARVRYYSVLPYGGWPFSPLVEWLRR